jgi:hypothetical protein
MQNFIKVEWIASWRALNGFVQLRSSFEFFSCCTIMCTSTKLQVFANFWPQKYYNHLSHPVLSRFVSARLLSVPQSENEVKRTPLTDVAETQEAVTDEWKKVQKEEFSTAFQKLYNQACIHASGAYFELKKKRYMSSIFKKSLLKLLDRSMYISCGFQN